jgi:hypothetical protein
LLYRRFTIHATGKKEADTRGRTWILPPQMLKSIKILFLPNPFYPAGVLAMEIANIFAQIFLPVFKK